MSGTSSASCQPTARRDVFASACQGCGADVSCVAQSPCEAYDRVESLRSSRRDACRCMAVSARVAPSASRPSRRRLGAGIAVRAKPARLCDLSALCPGHSAGAIEPRAARPVRPDISEGALVNILDASREPFAMQTSLIKARLLRAPRGLGRNRMRSARAIVALGVPSRRQCRLHRRQTPLQGVVHAFLAIGARITGFRTAMAARWAGQRASIRSASRISSATSNTRSTLATRCSRPA